MLTFRATILLLIAGPLLALAAWQPAMAWVALAWFIIVLLLIIIDRFAAGSVQQFEIQRNHDSRLSLGADNTIRLQLHHRGKNKVNFQLRDEIPTGWRENTPFFNGTLAPATEFTTSYQVHPLRRGDYTFGKLNLRWDGPLRLWHRQGKLDADAPVKVYPNLLEVRRYDLMLRKNRLREIGLRNTRILGRGTEFERLRDYVPDDDFRKIDWKATARRHRPITKEFQVERSQNIMAVLDIGRMMQSPVAHIAKLDYVINAALLLAYVGSGMGDKIGLMTFADDVHQFLTPRQGRAQFYRMLEQLYAVNTQPVEPDYRRAFTYLGAKHRQRSLVVIFTDLSGGMGMQSLLTSVTMLAKRSLPLIVTISDPDIHATVATPPTTSLGVYQQAAAARLLDNRKTTLEQLRRRGVLTLDVPANKLSLSVINRYLALKSRLTL